MMNSKNWNDRADKDLFFTILSVKNIGVISGAEWTIIGQHMRTLGYGFSNEGCRQHFQGLRRAQNKIEPSNGTTPGSGAISTAAAAANKVDPALNPITRRPGGPGRRRSRKLSSAAEGNAEGSGDSTQASTGVVIGTVDAETTSVVTALADVRANLEEEDTKVDPDGEGEIDPDVPPVSNGTTPGLSAELLVAAATSGLQPLLAHTHGHTHVHPPQLPPQPVGNGTVADNGVVMTGLGGVLGMSAGDPP
ncbi:hypothetical protein Sste5344_000648 [Sporothrix stenoceras]